MKVEELYELFVKHPAVTTDSRNCPEGSIFFALKGEHFDGNRFAEKALASGCSYAVIDDPACFTGERTIQVENVLDMLQRLALYHRMTLNIPVLAITGTNGKTTTKELVAAVLSTRFNVLYTEGNLNNQIGVPLTLLRLNDTHEMAVIEMGASRPGDINELTGIAQPDYGMITNVGQAHLEGFKSFGNVLKTKGELFDYLRYIDGTAFLKKEDLQLQSIADGINKITYGSDKNAFVSGQIAGNDPFLVFRWKLQQGETHTVKTRLIGGYNIDNVLAAVTIGSYFNIPPAEINRAIESYTPSNNRSQWKKTYRNHLIVDAYNANPTSMKIALENFAALPRLPKAVILGDMLELGRSGKRMHMEIAGLLKTLRFHEVLLCGDLFFHSTKHFRVFRTTDDLADYLKEHPLKGYNILLKGSRGMALETVLKYL
ncbi:MAG: UDP-N-acetylmuramoyl-tripeptide--D-alanyl-D-alanine ligase [Tannerellaceae bacterium]|jgi:UDP-N-acetylmuramoyl-tripeptide--D-alanyl-D-alanine ligase|nr:UDP-N-acetylmuramoyl-tripeptide--D-alanyl-D-alanine ligase [Tannerellaceae bacterium]